MLKRDFFQADLPNLDKEIVEGLQNGDLVLTPDALRFRPDEFLILEKEVVSISGVWDLPLLGAEALDVEHLYQMETGGPEVTLTDLDGVFVERGDVVCQLQEDYEENEYTVGSKAHGEAVEEKIAGTELTKEQAEELRRTYATQRKQHLEKRTSQTREQRSYPAGKLPNDAVYVVRTSKLREFEQALMKLEPELETSTNPRQETTLLNIIGGLLGLLLGSTPAGRPQSVFDSQSSVIDALLATHEHRPGMSNRTLQEKFAAAKRSLKS